jgi:hypothetical protein
MSIKKKDGQRIKKMHGNFLDSGVDIAKELATVRLSET